MANVWIEESILQGWGETIREKTGGTKLMVPSELLEATKALEVGSGGEFDDFLKYFMCEIDVDNRQIIIYRILYDKLGDSTDITIPDRINGYNVVLYSAGI